MNKKILVARIVTIILALCCILALMFIILYFKSSCTEDKKDLANADTVNTVNTFLICCPGD